MTLDIGDEAVRIGAARHTASSQAKWGSNMVATYDRHGITFLYPRNWTLTTEDSPHSECRCVTVQSPESGFWMLQTFGGPETPERLAAEALQLLKQDYGELEVVPIDEEMGATRLVGYDLQFFYLDFLVRCQVRSFALADSNCVVLCQAEDGEFDQLAQIFSAITTSLLKAVAWP